MIVLWRCYNTIIWSESRNDPKAEISSWDNLAFDEFDLGKVSDGKYAATYANFTIPGTYSVVINLFDLTFITILNINH